MWPSQRVTCLPITPYGVIGYHVTLSKGHMIAITPYKDTLVPHLVATLIYLSQNYSYYIRGDRSPLTENAWCDWLRADGLYNSSIRADFRCRTVIVQAMKNRATSFPCQPLYGRIGLIVATTIPKQSRRRYKVLIQWCSASKDAEHHWTSILCARLLPDGSIAMMVEAWRHTDLNALCDAVAI